MGEQTTDADGTPVDDGLAAGNDAATAFDTPTAFDTAADLAGLDQPEDEATEHALRLMDEALRRSEAGRRWLVAGDP